MPQSGRGTRCPRRGPGAAHGWWWMNVEPNIFLRARRLPAAWLLERRQQLHTPGSSKAALSPIQQLGRCCRVTRECWMRCTSLGYLSCSSASGFFKEMR